MKLVVDASVAAKWYIEEADSLAAWRWMESEAEFVAPDLILAEVGNVLRRRMRFERISVGQASKALEALRRKVDHSTPIHDLIDDAWMLSLDLDHSVYDCVYVALARHEQTGLLTADTKLAEKLERTGMLAEVLLPADTPPKHFMTK